MSRWTCDTCPFSTSDPDALRGHEDYAPPRGWLGRGEQHRMYRQTIHTRSQDEPAPSWGERGPQTAAEYDDESVNDAVLGLAGTDAEPENTIDYTAAVEQVMAHKARKADQ